MKISVVTPSLNYGRFLSDAIDSVSAQDYPDVEHIIVDGASTDNTLDILRKYEHLPHVRWISEPDSGQSDALNKGLQMATGDVVGWLNADEYYLPGALDTVRRVFEERPGADVVYGDVLFVDESKRPLKVRKAHRFDRNVLLYYGCFIATVATFFRRRVVEDGNLMDTDIGVNMDSEFFMKLAAGGYRFEFVRKTLGAFIWHDGNLSGQDPERCREVRLRIQRRYGPAFTRKHERLGTIFFDTAAKVYLVKRQFLKLLR